MYSITHALLWNPLGIVFVKYAIQIHIIMCALKVNNNPLSSPIVVD